MENEGQWDTVQRNLEQPDREATVAVGIDAATHPPASAGVPYRPGDPRFPDVWGCRTLTHAGSPGSSRI
jgi:hypothetical protein